MRKWWGSGSQVGGVLEDPTNPSAAHQHLALGLMHLKKVFSEDSIPPHPLSELEKEDKLYNMLPLFCKVSDVRLYNTKEGQDHISSHI